MRNLRCAFPLIAHRYKPAEVDENFDYIRETLLSSNTSMDRYIRKPFVEKIIHEHAGGTNHRLLIWSFISFEAWCRKFGM